MYDKSDFTMRPFFELCDETARRETRSAHVFGMPPIPDGEYGFIDLYCEDPDCDCRRSIISVLSPNLEIVATLSYGWETRDFYEKWVGGSEFVDMMAGVMLEPLAPQAPYADHILDLFRKILSDDPEYASRFPRHYREFKAAIGAQSPIVGTRSHRPKKKRALRL